MFFFTLSWATQRRKLLNALARVTTEAHAIGDLDTAMLASVGEASVAFLTGVPLEAVQARFAVVARSLQTPSAPVRRVSAACRSQIELLCGHRAEFAGEPRHEIVELCEHATGAPTVGESLAATIAMVVAYFLENYEEAMSYGDAAEARIENRDALFPHVSEYYLYRGLTAATFDPLASGRQRRRYRRILLRCSQALRRLAHGGPDNFEHPALLLEAERARLAGNQQRALTLYSRSADRAEIQGYPQHAGLAHERRGILCLELGLVSEAARYIREALDCYQEWGATVLVRRLRDAHGQLLSVYDPKRGPEERVSSASGGFHTATTTTSTSTWGSTTSSTATSGLEAATLDLATVLRSSEAISGEVALERVIERVLEIAIESAGAQRAILLLETDGMLRVEAESVAGAQACKHFDRIPLGSARHLLPVNLIQYVQRTQRSVVLRNAALEGLFVDDPYVVDRGLCSALCIPILRQGRLVGVLYLENALVTDAFTENRVEVLRMLSSHAAISLDNARLYSELTDLNRDLEARIEERTVKLREARDAAETATQAKSEFLAVMSHEIRTPMNVVIGMAQIMMETRLSADQRECVRAIHTAGDSLLTVIDDILDFSKIEAGRLELEYAAFSLRRMLEEVSEILFPKAASKCLEFPVCVDRHVPDVLQGDPNRLKQVVINLANNAIKFTEEGSVQIRVECRDAAAGRARLRFEVIDTGIGIPKRRLDRLFQSFSQVDASTTRRFGGTGLGLVISKRLVDAMGGVVGVESVEGEGSTFWFEVELSTAPDTAQGAEPDLSPARALVLISHRESGVALVEQIAALGASALWVPDLREARERALAAQASAKPFTALLLRYPFEDESGSSDLTALRDSLSQDAASFLICPLLQRAAAERELEKGHAGILGPPVSRTQLREALARSIGLALPEFDVGLQRPSPELRRSRSRFRILVAEDYALNRKMAVQMLTRAGYRCDVVEDGRRALRALEQNHYDLVFMDCQMPEVDGLTATRQIRRREAIEGGHLPIVAMTANAMKGDRERCLAAGMDDYLSKPIQLEALYAVLERYLVSDAERR